MSLCVMYITTVAKIVISEVPRTVQWNNYIRISTFIFYHDVLCHYHHISLNIWLRILLKVARICRPHIKPYVLRLRYYYSYQICGVILRPLFSAKTFFTSTPGYIPQVCWFIYSIDYLILMNHYHFIVRHLLHWILTNNFPEYISKNVPSN